MLRWRAQQDALGFLQSNLHGNGPTAKHVIHHTMQLKGLDAELRLQQDALHFEQYAAGGHRRLRSTMNRLNITAAVANMTREELVAMVAQML